MPERLADHSSGDEGRHHSEIHGLVARVPPHIRLFRASAMRTRRAYRARLADLEPEVKAIVAHHVAERSEKAAPRPLLGEMAPWLIADAFSIPDAEDVVREVVLNWLHIYYFTTLLDDYIDGGSQTKTPIRLIAASRLLQTGVCGLLRCSPSGSLLADLDGAFRLTSEAAIRELELHRYRITLFSPKELSSLGDKFAIIRLCAAAIAEVAGISHTRKDEVIRVLQNLSTALQLLDDVSDWREDLAAGNWTFPLTIALAGSPQSGGSAIAPAEVDLHRLASSGALEETLRAATAFVDEALKISKASLRGDCAVLAYLESLAAATRAADSAARELRERSATSHNVASQSLNDRDPCCLALARLEQTLKVVAQGF